MKKLLKRLTSKKGVTLVELIVVLFISSVLLGAAMGMLGPVNALMKSIKGNAHLDSLCNTANEYIRASIEKASGITMTGYTAGSENEVSAKFTALSSKADVNFKSDIKVIAVLKNSNGKFRLYDFGKVTDTATLEARLTNHTDRQYEVFSEGYYENNHYTVTINTPSGDPTAETITWAEIESKCFDGEGELASQPKTLSFQTLQKNMKFIGNTAVSSGTDEMPTNDGTVIIYKENDFTTPVAPVTPTPGGDGDGDDEGGDEPTLPGVDDGDDTYTPPSVGECLEVIGAGQVNITGWSTRYFTSNITIKNKASGYFRVNKIEIILEPQYRDEMPEEEKAYIEHKCSSLNFDSKIYDMTQTTPNSSDIHADPGNKMRVEINCDFLFKEGGTINVGNQWSTNDNIKDKWGWGGAPIFKDGYSNIRVFVNGTELFSN